MVVTLAISPTKEAKTIKITCSCKHYFSTICRFCEELLGNKLEYWGNSRYKECDLLTTHLINKTTCTYTLLSYS